MVENLFGTPHACEIYSAFKITLRSPSADFWYSHPKTQAPFCMCSVQVKTECSSKIMAIATHPFKCKNSFWLNRGFKYQEMTKLRVNFLLKIISEVLPVLTAVIYSVHWIVRQHQTKISGVMLKSQIKHWWLIFWVSDVTDWHLALCFILYNMKTILKENMISVKRSVQLAFP